MDRKRSEPGHRKDVSEMTIEELEDFIKKIPKEHVGVYIQQFRRHQSPILRKRIVV